MMKEKNSEQHMAIKFDQSHISLLYMQIKAFGKLIKRDIVTKSKLKAQIQKADILVIDLTKMVRKHIKKLFGALHEQIKQYQDYKSDNEMQKVCEICISFKNCQNLSEWEDLDSSIVNVERINFKLVVYDMQIRYNSIISLVQKAKEKINECISRLKKSTNIDYKDSEELIFKKMGDVALTFELFADEWANIFLDRLKELEEEMIVNKVQLEVIKSDLLLEKREKVSKFSYNKENKYFLKNEKNLENHQFSIKIPKDIKKLDIDKENTIDSIEEYKNDIEDTPTFHETSRLTEIGSVLDNQSSSFDSFTLDIGSCSKKKSEISSTKTSLNCNEQLTAIKILDLQTNLSSIQNDSLNSEVDEVDSEFHFEVDEADSKINFKRTNKIESEINFKRTPKIQNEADLMGKVFSFDLNHEIKVFGENGFLFSQNRKTGSRSNICYLALGKASYNVLDNINNVRILDDGVFVASTDNKGVFLINENSEIKTKEITRIKNGNFNITCFCLNKKKDCVLLRTEERKIRYYDIDLDYFEYKKKTESDIIKMQMIGDSYFIIFCKKHIYLLKDGKEHLIKSLNKGEEVKLFFS